MSYRLNRLNSFRRLNKVTPYFNDTIVLRLMVENKTQTHHNPNHKRIHPIAITKDNDKGKETVLLPEDNI